MNQITDTTGTDFKCYRKIPEWKETEGVERRVLWRLKT